MTKEELIEDIIEDLQENFYESKEYIFDLVREALRTRTINDLKQINA
jgi:hypothetical protein